MRKLPPYLCTDLCNGVSFSSSRAFTFAPFFINNSEIVSFPLKNEKFSEITQNSGSKKLFYKEKVEKVFITSCFMQCCLARISVSIDVSSILQQIFNDMDFVI